MILTRRVCWVSVPLLAPQIRSRAVSLPDGGPATEPRHHLPDSRATLRPHPRGTPLLPLRVLGSMTPPFPGPVVHAGPELHLPAAEGPLPLCLVSTLRFSSHSRQDQRDCALSPEVTVGSELRPKTFSGCLSETPQATRWAWGWAATSIHSPEKGKNVCNLRSFTQPDYHSV